MEHQTSRNSPRVKCSGDVHMVCTPAINNSLSHVKCLMCVLGASQASRTHHVKCHTSHVFCLHLKLHELTVSSAMNEACCAPSASAPGRVTSSKASRNTKCNADSGQNSGRKAQNRHPKWQNSDRHREPPTPKMQRRSPTKSGRKSANRH